MPGNWRASRESGWALLRADHALAEIAERVGAQPGNVHLGEAELLADLRLRHVVGKAHQQDFLLPQGQLAPVRCESMHAEHVLHPGVLLAEDIGQGDRTWLAGHGRVERGRPAGYLCQPRLPQISAGPLSGAGPSRSRLAHGPRSWVSW